MRRIQNFKVDLITRALSANRLADCRHQLLEKLPPFQREHTGHVFQNKHPGRKALKQSNVVPEQMVSWIIRTPRMRIEGEALAWWPTQEYVKFANFECSAPAGGSYCFEDLASVDVLYGTSERGNFTRLLPACRRVPPVKIHKKGMQSDVPNIIGKFRCEPSLMEATGQTASPAEKLANDIFRRAITLRSHE